MFALRTIELPDCPATLPTWTPLVVGGTVLVLVALALLTLLIYRKIEATREVRIAQEHTKQKQIDYDMQISRDLHHTAHVPDPFRGMK